MSYHLGYYQLHGMACGSICWHIRYYGMLDTLGVLTVAVCVDLPPCDPTSGLSSGLLLIVLKPYLLVE